MIRPMVNRDSAYFWEGTAAGELRIQKCNACGELRHPPGPACPTCGAFDRGHVVAAGEGTVFSYIVHRHPPVPGKELPIVIALIDVDEGVRMVGEVADVADDEIEIGMRLRVEFNRVDDDLTLPIWTRVPEEGK
ncbi:MAG: OB-fold domain-containing protein [Propionibacteriales bacterium]|nr:OB-fold domain-containing protein [Propionibacteriales bacterium]